MTSHIQNANDAHPTPGLTGRTVAILEARRSAELAKLFEQRGAVVYVAPALEAGLEALGARVRDGRVYQWALPEDIEPVRGFIDRLGAGAFDAVAFTSASQVHNLFAIAEQLDQAEPLHRALGRVSALVA